MGAQGLQATSNVPISLWPVAHLVCMAVSERTEDEQQSC